MVKRFQNTVATGRFTLPITIVYAVIMLFVCGAITPSHWIQLILLGFSTFLMVILNNSNSLIRVFSRLVSCTFLTMMVMIPSLLDSISGCAVQLLFILALLLLFKAYQDHYAVGTIFYAFLCIGCISTQFIQILFFVPFLWVLVFTSLQAGSFKVLVASILGLILPYWFWECYCIYGGDPWFVLDYITSISQFGYVTEGLFQPSLLVSLVLILVLGGVGTIHFLTFGYADNIKTRMFYNTIITLFIAATVFLILQPQHSNYLLRIAIICLSPLVAHFFTFTNTWITNMAFYATMIVVVAITILNAWIF